MKHLLPAIVFFTGFTTLLPAQSTQTMRANIRGGGGDTQKCTIEVEVDGSADVEIRGNVGYIRTLQGQPSTWRRFECTSAIPRNPIDFRFKGVDGRGDVRLVRDPANSGSAVVRIDDRQGGREGYTFDLEWRGGSGAYTSDDRLRNNGPFGNRNNRYDRNNDRYSRSRNDVSDDRQAIGLCQEEVRVRARRDYGVRNPSFATRDVDDVNRNRDRVIGTFEGNRGERYDYSCTVNTNNGRIRDIDIRRR